MSVVKWIIKNQFGRRNLSLLDRSRLALRLEEVKTIEAKATPEQKTELATGKAAPQEIDFLTGDTAFSIK